MKQKTLNIIAAHDLNHGIGINNELPWSIGEDLKWFKDHTTNKTIMMGSKTFRSLPVKPLSNRKNVVVTNNPQAFKEEFEDIANDIDVYSSVNLALDAYHNQNDSWFIIGGASIYEQTINMADYMYITVVDDVYEADTFFPLYESTWMLEDNVKYIDTKDRKNNVTVGITFSIFKKSFNNY